MTHLKIIPKDLATVLWSYDVSKLDLWRDRRTIIVNAINYGDLKQWRWLVKSYGAGEVKQVIANERSTALRHRARKLFLLLLNSD